MASPLIVRSWRGCCSDSLKQLEPLLGLESGLFGKVAAAMHSDIPRIVEHLKENPSLNSQFITSMGLNGSSVAELYGCLAACAANNISYAVETFPVLWDVSSSPAGSTPLSRLDMARAQEQAAGKLWLLLPVMW